MTHLIFAANWKMHLGPEGARKFMDEFVEAYRPQPDREVWLFPSAVAVETVAIQLRERSDIRVGVQNLYWEPKGAFTGELSVSMAKEAGGSVALVGHSERRHVFGETDEETSRKVTALLEAGLTPVLCVGEKLEEREAGETISVVKRQLGVLEGLDPEILAGIPIAYEPVWAIGTGRTATPADAAEVHSAIRAWFGGRGADTGSVKILYGGSVKVENVHALVSEPDVDGVLVGGASLDPAQWAAIASTSID
jgi:triosephosphate isomerase